MILSCYGALEIVDAIAIWPKKYSKKKKLEVSLATSAHPAAI